MTDAAKCPVDGRAVVYSGRGRPPTYCGSACQRIAALEIARIDRRLAAREQRITDLAAPFDSETKLAALVSGVTSAEYVSQTRKALTEANARDSTRLRALLGNDPTPSLADTPRPARSSVSNAPPSEAP